jgi:hypothetical protein
MPSLEHNGLVEMFRDNPALAPHLLEMLFHLDLPAHAAVTVGETALDQLLPIEYRADLVLELRDTAGALVLAIVLEVQRDEDADKKYTLPVYVTVVRARKRCPAVVLVVAPDPKVAAWAADPIDLGLGLGTVKPLVLGPAIVPVVTDEAEAMREAELSVLSAVAHGNGPEGLPVVLAALAALGRLDQEHAVVYFEIIYKARRAPMQRALEAKIMERQSAVKVTYPPFLQRLVEGGELKGKRDTLLRLVRRAGIAFTPDDEARMLACADPETLDRWVDNVLTAKTIGEVLT